MAERGFVQAGGFLLAILEIADAQPAAVARAGERHVEKPQILLQPFAFGGSECSAGRLKIQRGLVGVVVPDEAVSEFRLAQAADERQHHHGVFQPLGLVDGDDLDQPRFAFQPHDFLVGGFHRATGIGNLGGQVADQRMFAIQRGGGLLQQFGQMQQVGQRALAIGAGQQCRGQAERMQQVVHHRQHAMAQPGVVQLAEAVAAAFPVHLVLIQAIQLGITLAQRVAGQRRAHGAVGAGLGAGVQPQQQVVGLGRGVHRIAVGQIDAGQPARLQRIAHELRFATGAHQDGDIASGQWFEAALRVGETAFTALRRIQPLHQRGGGVCGHHLLVGVLAHRRSVGGHGELQRGHGQAVQQQALRAPLRGYRQEGQAVLILAEQEGTLCVFLGETEHAVHCLDHVLGGAVVGGERPGRLAGAVARQ